MKQYMTYFPKCMSSISLFHFMPMLSYILEFGLAGVSYANISFDIGLYTTNSTELVLFIITS